MDNSGNNTQDLFDQLNQMLNNKDVYKNLKDIMQQFQQASNNNDENSSTHTESTNIDMDTLLKMKKVMDAMKSNNNDPRANLLLSLKPYLKESRQKKVEEYIKLFGITKAFEAFNQLGGDTKNEI